MASEAAVCRKSCGVIAFGVNADDPEGAATMHRRDSVARLMVSGQESLMLIKRFDLAGVGVHAGKRASLLRQPRKHSDGLVLDSYRDAVQSWPWRMQC